MPLLLDHIATKQPSQLSSCRSRKEVVHVQTQTPSGQRVLVPDMWQTCFGICQLSPVAPGLESDTVSPFGDGNSLHEQCNQVELIKPPLAGTVCYSRPTQNS